MIGKEGETRYEREVVNYDYDSHYYHDLEDYVAHWEQRHNSHIMQVNIF